MRVFHSHALGMFYLGSSPNETSKSIIRSRTKHCPRSPGEFGATRQYSRSEGPASGWHSTRGTQGCASASPNFAQTPGLRTTQTRGCWSEEPADIRDEML